MLLADSGYTGWYAGFAIAAAVVVIVVIVVSLILTLAHKIGQQAEQIALGLDDARANTVVLDQIPNLNSTVLTVNRRAAAAREAATAKVIQLGLVKESDL